MNCQKRSTKQVFCETTNSCCFLVGLQEGEVSWLVQRWSPNPVGRHASSQGVTFCDVPGVSMQPELPESSGSGLWEFLTNLWSSLGRLSFRTPAEGTVSTPENKPNSSWHGWCGRCGGFLGPPRPSRAFRSTFRAPWRPFAAQALLLLGVQLPSIDLPSHHLLGGDPSDSTLHAQTPRNATLEASNGRGSVVSNP